LEVFMLRTLNPTQIIISLKPSVNALIDCHIMSLQPITVDLHFINDLLVSTRYHARLWLGLNDSITLSCLDEKRASGISWGMLMFGNQQGCWKPLNQQRVLNQAVQKSYSGRLAHHRSLAYGRTIYILRDLKCYRSAFSSFTNHLWNGEPRDQPKKSSK
jgi:hypothetical protein